MLRPKGQYGLIKHNPINLHNIFRCLFEQITYGGDIIKKFSFTALIIILLISLSLPTYAVTAVGDKVILGGMPFGVRYSTNTVIADSFCDVNGEKSPASAAGIKKEDIICKINDKQMTAASDVINEIENSEGKSLNIMCSRDEKEIEFSVTPIKSDRDGKYKIGIIIRDSSAGIGTITYINPKTHEFGGLGHGICSQETNKLIDFGHSTVNDVVISGITKGVEGTPGELKGYFTANKIGAVSKNTLCGVFGYITDKAKYEGKSIEIASINEIESGDAVLYAALDTGNICEYKIKISIEENNSKNFNIKITDKKLIEKTGGIVQGMSGSPIIQDGKLVGAVTHVLVNDPTQGYGIFIENMLNEAE